MCRQMFASTPRLQKFAYLCTLKFVLSTLPFYIQNVFEFLRHHTFKMSQPSLPFYKAACESAAEAQRLADNAARVAAFLQVGALNSALMREQMMAALDHQRAYLGQRDLHGHNADLLANNVALRARIAELEQQHRPARPAQPVIQAPANASGSGRDGNGGSAYGGDHKKKRRRGQGRSKKYQGKPPGPRRDDGAGGSGASLKSA